MSAFFVLFFFFYLLRLHISGGEIFDTVHEAVLRYFVVSPQKLFELQVKQKIHSSEANHYFPNFYLMLRRAKWPYKKERH